MVDLFQMKKKFRIITGIMVFSLIGIFLLQTFWLYNYYEFSREQFKKDITDVLERKSNQAVVSEARKLGLGKTGSKKDFKEITDKLNKILSIGSSSDTGGNGGKNTILITMTLSGSDKKDSKRDTLRNIKNQDKSETTTISTNKDSLYNSAELRALVPSLRKGLDSLLRQKGISAKYAVKLYNNSNKGSFFLDDLKLYNNVKVKQPEIRIGIMKPYYMQLAIEPDYLFFLKEMQHILIASFLIIAIVCFSLIYMIRVIFRQKRIADMKTDFINNMTHEFKTPLTTIALGVEAMKNFDVISKPELASEYLDICESEVKRVTDMIDKILRLSAFERSEVVLNFHQVNVVTVIEDAINNMQFMLNNAKSRLVFSPAEPIVLMKGDKTHLSGVIYNLIDNSLKYAGKDSFIEISCKRNADQVVIEFRDNGPGIPRQYQHRIFEKFFRIPTDNRAKVNGFGLGLNYVSTIVQMHNGSIVLNNDNQQGVHFTIKFS